MNWYLRWNLDIIRSNSIAVILNIELAEHVFEKLAYGWRRSCGNDNEITKKQRNTTTFILKMLFIHYITTFSLK